MEVKLKASFDQKKLECTQLEKQLKEAELYFKQSLQNLEHLVSQKEGEIQSCKNLYEKENALNDQKRKFLEEQIKDLKQKLEDQQESYQKVLNNYKDLEQEENSGKSILEDQIRDERNQFEIARKELQQKLSAQEQAFEDQIEKITTEKESL